MEWKIWFIDGDSIVVRGKTIIEGLENLGYGEKVLKDVINFEIYNPVPDAWETNHCR
jgi:hypothetical protein